MDFVHRLGNTKTTRNHKNGRQINTVDRMDSVGVIVWRLRLQGRNMSARRMLKHRSDTMNARNSFYVLLTLTLLGCGSSSDGNAPSGDNPATGGDASLEGPATGGKAATGGDFASATGGALNTGGTGAAMATTAANCPSGSPGCPCYTSGMCSSGHSCNSNKICSGIPAGTDGACPALPSYQGETLDSIIASGRQCLDSSRSSYCSAGVCTSCPYDSSLGTLYKNCDGLDANGCETWVAGQACP